MIGADMKIIFTKSVFAVLFFAILFNLSLSYEPKKPVSKDLAVLIDSKVIEGAEPAVELSWDLMSPAETYSIFRKTVDQTSFLPLAADIPEYQNSFIDYNVEAGVRYEYEVRANCHGLFAATSSQGEDTTVVLPYIAFGYACIGVEAPELDAERKVLLLVDVTVAAALSEEIERLEDDLIAEGWGVVMRTCERAEEFDPEKVAAAKAIVLEEYNADPNRLTTVFLLGRVPVPYSGNLNPDAHGNHKGAWPADVYYASMNNLFWSDSYVNNVTASREANKNVPGDGKFDQSEIGALANVNLQVGRVDFYNMPAFAEETGDPELTLLKRYLDKNHAYRSGEMEISDQGLIDDNFKGMIEAFGSSGWRNIGTFLENDKVTESDWFGTLKEEKRFWAYGCGGGNYDKCSGVGNTENFASQDVNAVFTMLFGSYFGDWDAQNNFLRAPLATSPSVLTCAWDGRPHWFFHHMASGYNIGYSTLVSQTNTVQTYKPNVYFLPQYPNGVVYAIGFEGTHIALMGDPTLKMYRDDAPKPLNVSVVQPAGKPVELNWEVPDTDDIVFFNVYKSENENGPWEKLNTERFAETSFTDEDLFEGDVYYMVRTSKLRETIGGGRFYDQSLAEIKNLLVTGVDEDPQGEFEMLVSPNPADVVANFQIYLPAPSRFTLEIYGTNGAKLAEICDRNLASGAQAFSWDLTSDFGGKIPSGVYVVKATVGGEIFVEKLIVRR